MMQPSAISRRSDLGNIESGNPPSVKRCQDFCRFITVITGLGGAGLSTASFMALAGKLASVAALAAKAAAAISVTVITAKVILLTGGALGAGIAAIALIILLRKQELKLDGNEGDRDGNGSKIDVGGGHNNENEMGEIIDLPSGIEDIEFVAENDYPEWDNESGMPTQPDDVLEAVGLFEPQPWTELPQTGDFELPSMVVDDEGLIVGDDQPAHPSIQIDDRLAEKREDSSQLSIRPEESERELPLGDLTPNESQPPIEEL